MEWHHRPRQRQTATPTPGIKNQSDAYHWCIVSLASLAANQTRVIEDWCRGADSAKSQADRAAETQSAQHVCHSKKRSSSCPQRVKAAPQHANTLLANPAPRLFCRSKNGFPT